MLLKYLSNFWRNPEKSLINGEIHLQLAWRANCVITNSTSAGTFPITNTRIYVQVASLSTQDNTKIQQLNSRFERKVNWNKYLTKNPNLNPDWNLNYVVSQVFKESTEFSCYCLKMMMMNCFCGMVDRRKKFSLISSQDHCQRFSPS